jgi:hypothetical protein
VPKTLAGRFLTHEHPLLSMLVWWLGPRWHSVLVLRDRWETLCRETARNGDIEALHAAREDIEAVFNQYLTLLKSQLALLDLTERLTENDRELQEIRTDLTRVTDELTRLYNEIFPRWQSLDDLGEVLIEKVPLNAVQLEGLAERHPPPKSWYDDDFDPFTPAAPE